MAHLEQSAAGSPLHRVEPGIGADPSIEEPIAVVIEAAAPAAADRAAIAQDAARSPGAPFIGRDAEHRRVLVVGFAPCGACLPCRAALSLACSAPRRPGVDVPGGFGERAVVPAAAVVPHVPEDVDAPAAVAVVSLAGSTYQAMATVGMVPGDTVVIFGDAGPGSLPLQVLRAAGMRPALVRAEGPPVHLPEGCTHFERAPTIDALSTLRFHVLDLAGSADEWLPLAATSISCTIASPTLADSVAPALSRVLAGQTAARWIRDLHPHLALELVAMVRRGQVDAASWIDVTDLDGMIARFASLATATRWPIYRA